MTDILPDDLAISSFCAMQNEDIVKIEAPEFQLGCQRYSFLEDVAARLKIDDGRTKLHIIFKILLSY